MQTAQTESIPTTVAESLRKYLSCYWLRPENAFWMTLRSEALGNTELPRPSIDLSCGDGIFSFIHAGGEVDFEFDVFCSVGRLEAVTNDHADMFDHTDASYGPPVRRSAHSISCGTDWKQNLLDKAKKLDLYDELILHDSNERLPFENESYQTVHCNSAYWVKNIDSFLAEIQRILQPDGRAYLSVKLDCMREYTLQPLRSSLGDRFLEIIGRGRFETWPSVGSAEDWLRRFERANLDVVEAKPFITRTHAQIWDVGLRPIAPMLVKMANGLRPENRAAIKREWVELFMDLLTPICRADFDLFTTSSEPAEILYVLAPKE